MIRRILKKDMKRRKSINIILFLFITIASVFLSSSINNILVVSSAVNYYMDLANVPDVSFITADTSEKENISKWLEKEAPGVKAYDYNTMLFLDNKRISVLEDGRESAFSTNGVDAYLSTMDVGYCKVFDESGGTFTLKSGEIAISTTSMERNKLKVGDRIQIKAGDTEKEFTLKLAVKDAAFGSDMVGMNRMIVNKSDYSQFADDEKINALGMYYVETDDETALSQKLNNQGFQASINIITRNTYSMVYSFDMIMAGLLILIGICLILIALLVLRFTLVFTMEEDYREIGIMKAVGLRDFVIKKIYLVKYLMIVTTGALMGLILSIPVGNAMVANVSKNMIMEDSSANWWVNIVCTGLIIVLVMLFCYGCTRKLNKVAAITAIRGGQTGERYSRRAGIKLHRSSYMPVAVFLGINDMLRHVKRYLILLITFCISFILITIPLNTINTMQSKEMATKFCIDPDSAVYVQKMEKEGETYSSSKDLKKGLERVTRELRVQGYQAELTAVMIYFFKYGEKDSADKSNIMTIQLLGKNNGYLTYQEGVAPVLADEIAISKQIMEENKWQIGDSVETVINGETRKFIITGTYSDYMQIGKSVRMNPKIDISGEKMFGYWNTMVDMDTEETQAELAAKLKKQLPDYEWLDSQEIIDKNVGGIQQSLQDMLLPMTGMLCAVIMLITFLMERLFIVREKGEIAMMKSVGYKNRVIRLWQVLRMVWVVLISMVAAVPLSLLSNEYLLKSIFAIMGADVAIQINSWQVYGLYPIILLSGIVLATFAATRNVKKINIQELNNLE